ncbi:hypothetical protein GIB67_025753, partial [Kingdonia uniflora]
WLLDVIELIAALHINLGSNIVYQYKVVKAVEELINFHQVCNGWTYWPMDPSLMIPYMTKRRAEALEQLRAYEGVSAQYSFSFMFLVHMDINQEVCSGGGGAESFTARFLFRLNDLSKDTLLDGAPYASEAVIWFSGDLFGDNFHVIGSIIFSSWFGTSDSLPSGCCSTSEESIATTSVSMFLLLDALSIVPLHP